MLEGRHCGVVFSLLRQPNARAADGSPVSDGAAAVAVGVRTDR